MKLVDISVVLFRLFYLYLFHERVEGEGKKEKQIGYDIISNNGDDDDDDVVVVGRVFISIVMYYFLWFLGIINLLCAQIMHFMAKSEPGN